MTDGLASSSQAPEAADEIAATPVGSIQELVARARASQTAWRERPLHERIALVGRVRRFALADARRACELIVRETGKPFEEALTAEALTIADLLDYWSASIESLLEASSIDPDALYFPGKRGRVERLPRGVVALITPWNFPIAIPLRTIVPALMAGNAVLFKPSEHAPRTGALLASWFEQVLPPGLLQVVQGGADAARAVIEAGVDAVCFTGGVDNGRKVSVACAQRLLPCSLELGGKDAAVVLADAKLERAARGIAWGAFNNTGQNCASIERVYVERAIADRFLQRLVAITRGLKAGVDYGHMTTRAQFELAREHLQDAVARGGQILAGGAPEGASSAFAPTIVRVEDESCRLMTEETFGPLVGVVVVDRAEQAVERINRSRFGLTASVWSKRINKAQALARRLEVGVVTINNHGFSAALPMAPWSGTRDSAGGVTNSPFAIDFLTRPFFLLTDRSGGERELWWHPYTPTLQRAGLELARARGGAGLLGRLAAVFKLLWLLPKRLFADR